MAITNYRRVVISLFSSSRNIRNKEIAYKPIVIIGGGPSGIYLSSLLSSSNIPSILLERKSYKELTTHPQAHYINLRSLEILRHCSSSLYQNILKAMPDINTWEYFRFSYSVLGNRLCNVLHNVNRTNKNRNANKYSSGSSVIDDISCVHLSQNKFWRLLYDDAISCNSEIHLSTNVNNISYNKEEDMFYVTYTNKEQQTIKTNCIIAGDGAHSLVRKYSSIQMNGNPSIQTLLNVHFRIKSSMLQQELARRENNGMLHFIYNEKLLCVFVCHDVHDGEWVCQIPIFPPLSTNYTLEDIKLMILQGLVLGKENDIKRNYWNSIDICSINTWNMSSQIANSYYKKYGNSHVILIGDAAHTFPPAGGLGMNTGLQDAHNLFWRLILYYNKSNDALFEMYEKERKSIAQQNATLSNENYQRTIRIVNITLTGFDSYSNYTNVSKLSKSMQDIISQNLPMPSMMKSQVFNTMYTMALSSLHLLRNENLFTRRIQYLLQHVLNEKSEGLPLIFPKYELGFSYCYDNDSQGNMEFVPRLQAGSRMPHCNMSLVRSCETKKVFPYLRIDGSDGRGTITLTDISQQLRNDICTSPYFACLFYKINKCDDDDEIVQNMKNEIEAINDQNNITMNLVHVLQPNDNMDQTIHKHYIPVIDTNSIFLNLLQKDHAVQMKKYHHVVVIVRPDGHIMTVKFLTDCDGSNSKENTILIDTMEHTANSGYRCQ